MFFQLFTFALAAILADAVVAPMVKLEAATVTGNSVGNVHRFLGIPFVQPP
jgi:cholinesterase